MRKIITFTRRHKYKIYLASILFMLGGQMFLPVGIEALWQHIVIIQNVIFGLLLFEKVHIGLKSFVVLLCIAVVLQCVALYWIDNEVIRFSMGAMFFLYFTTIFFIICIDVLSAKDVELETIAAVFSGFVMLGFIGGFIFTLVEIYRPESFTNLGIGEEVFQNLNYFSFISLLTVGYGDIVPISQVAKKTSIFLGLMGNFYLTFITAVIIGKFLNIKNK